MSAPTQATLLPRFAFEKANVKPEITQATVITQMIRLRRLSHL